MVFSSPVFAFLFLPAVVALYFAVPGKWRNGLLLVASLVFYAWGESYHTAILLVSILLNHFCGRLISALGKTRCGRTALATGIALNVTLLALFKYANFLVGAAVNPLLMAAGLRPLALGPVHLPIGISFFTFHGLSYLVDVYRGSAQAQPRLSTTALYITLFPQLVAGPIVRYKDISAQLVERRVALDDLAAGVRRFIIGLGKKMLIANSVAITADQVFLTPPDQLTAPVAWLGIVCYTLQIYFDFAGYSDMAIGLARMFGFHFLENFNYPYVSQSTQEFWRRWHISLSNWFRDYLYIPLGGNRRSSLRTYANLVTVFFLCGLWHGASWTFVAWGLYHGAFLVIERLGWGAILTRLPRPIRHAYTLLAIVGGWILFRSDTLHQARMFVFAMFGLGPQAAMQSSLSGYLGPGLVVAILAGILFSMPVASQWAGKTAQGTAESLEGRARARQALTGAVEVAGLALVLVLSLVQVGADTWNPFIYFRF